MKGTEQIATSFKQAHPFRVPLDKDQHVRFTSLDLAAESAVYHKS